MSMLPPLMEQKASSLPELQQCRTVINDVSDSLGEIRSHCLSVVSLAQQWRTLQSTFSLAQDEVERKEMELRKRFEAVELREREVNDRCEGMEVENERIIKRQVEFERQEREIKERFEEVGVKEREIEDRFVEVVSKEREIQEQFEDLVSKKKKVVEHSLMVGLKEGKVKEQFEVLELRERGIEERFVVVESKEREFKERFDVLELREKGIEERFVVVESKEREFKERFEVLELKEKEIEERFADLELKNKEISSVCMEMERRKKELELNEKKLNEDCESLKAKERQIDERMKEVNVVNEGLEAEKRLVREYNDQIQLIDKLVKEKGVELELKETELHKSLQAVELREKQNRLQSDALGLRERVIEEKGMALEVREKQNPHQSEALRLRQKEIEEKGMALTVREEQNRQQSEALRFKQKEIEEKGMALTVREEQNRQQSEALRLKQKEIKEKGMALTVREEQNRQQSEALRLRQKEIEEKGVALEVREKKELELKDKMLSEYCESLKAKDRQMDERMKEVNAEKQMLAEYNDEIQLLDKLVKEREVELELKDTELRKSLQAVELREKQNRQQSEALRLRQKEIEDKGMALEVREKEFDKRCQEREMREKETIDDVPIMETDGQWNDLTLVDDGETLQLLLNDRVDEHCFMGEGVLKALRLYNDPAALVLSAVNGFFPPHLKKGEVGYTGRTVRSSCLLLLEQFMNVKPEVSKNVRVKAEEMASFWRQKMQESGERRILVLGFLLLVAGFRLKGEFERDELKRLWEIIDQHRLAPQLRFELDLFEEGEENRAFSQRGTDDMNICNEILSACTNMDSDRVRSYLNKHVMDHKLFPSKIVDALKSSPDPAKLVFKVLESFNVPKSSTIDKTSCIFLLEQLMKLQKHQSVRNPLGKVEQVSSPPLEITQDMRINALAFASRWKSRLTEEGWKPLDVYGFLQFVASYKLASFYDENEVMRLFRVLYDAQPVFWPEENPQLCRALGLTTKIPGVITSLIKEDRRLQAAQYIFTFMEEPHFPLAPLLNVHVKFIQQTVQKIRGPSNIKSTEKNKVMTELSCLRDVHQYIKDFNYKLEQECLPIALESRMIQLEAAMANLKTDPPEAGHNSITPPVTKMKKDGSKVKNPRRLDKTIAKNPSFTLVAPSDQELNSNEPNWDCPQQGKRPKVEAGRLPSQSNISFKIPSVKTPSLPAKARALLPRKLLQPCPIKPTSQASESHDES